MRKIILSLIDPFYPIFRPIMDLQTYRYGVCGAGNTSLDIVVYFLCYNLLLQKEAINLGSLIISPHIAALIGGFLVSFPVGFFVMSTIVFTESDLRGRTQLFRYFSVIVFNLLLNYVFLKIMVEVLGIFPTVSKVIITAVIIVVSYLLQRKFTFGKVKS
jgi:putative flippase GtrA